MIDLGRADGWFNATGRGPCASFAKQRVPHSFGIQCPRQLLNTLVVIDGITYRVRGVEHFAVHCDGCDDAYALLVAKP